MSTKVWPPRRRNLHSEQATDPISTPRATPVAHCPSRLPPSTWILLPNHSHNSLDPPSPLANVVNKGKRKFCNRWEASPKAPLFSPYALNVSARKRFAKPLNKIQWNTLAATSRLLPQGCLIKNFQMQCGTALVSRVGDIVVIVPTGAGKSMLWCLLLLVFKDGISIVVTLYTSLGLEGEESMKKLGLSAVFIHANQRGEDITTNTVNGLYRVIFVCAEMLESPTFAAVVYSKRVQARLTAIYINEAHLVHETHEWRTSYLRLHQLRPIVGEHVPLFGISGQCCRNFRLELLTVIVPLQHEPTSFRDLAFILLNNATAASIVKTIIYCDNIEMLTKMFWWFNAQLKALRLPMYLLDLLHAGLSRNHERLALRDFCEGPGKIFLGTEKIGAGLNFPAVKRVVIYLVQNDLTVTKFEQRKGRAGRTKGATGIGILIAQPELFDEDAPFKVVRAMDLGLLKVIRTKEACYKAAIDKALENPPCLSPHGSDRHCCSNCHPLLLPPCHFEWVLVNPGEEGTQKRPTMAGLLGADVKDVLAQLTSWRLEIWRSNDIVPDGDLEALAKRITSIHTIDDLRPIVHIAYWTHVADPLLAAVKSAASTFSSSNSDASQFTSESPTQTAVTDGALPTQDSSSSSKLTELVCVRVFFAAAS
ncbi:P-loop containing nucleoside triphosphate hydrolase protein [Cytidiella melzeri]|nr:P-loop containing nucleoside triphosphate hydrolase protein [Cytidiella melzeri]